MVKMLREIKDLLLTEPNVIHIGDPVTVVGSLHGALHDAYHIVITNPKPPINKFIFLGNYVNRGGYSVETFLFLVAFKLSFAKEVILLRGPHETKIMCQHYNFKEECVGKYGEDIYEMIMQIFEHLPLACVVNGKYFCVSGGISPDFSKIEKLEHIE